MKKTCLTIAGLACLTAAVSRADVKINDNFSLAGYAVGSYDYDKLSGAPSSDSFNLDAAKLTLNTKFDQVSASFGAYYTETSNGENNLTLINAQVSYDFGGGLSLTGGRFLSWMGYEAFDAPNMLQVSSAYINDGGTIMFYPAYHEGLALKYSDADFTAGVALLDSLEGPSIYRGDGELKHNFGMEAFAQYTGIKDFVLWAGVGYDSKGAQSYQTHTVSVYNVWAQYTVGSAMFALEYIGQSAAKPSSGNDGLALLDYTFTKQFSTTFRVSAGKLDDVGPIDGLGFTKFTVSPTYTVNAHFSLRPEVSYIKYQHGAFKDETFTAIQAIFKF